MAGARRSNNRRRAAVARGNRWDALPGWVWLLFGAALAAFVIIVMQLAQPRHGNLQSALTPSTSAPPAQRPQKSTKITVPPPVPSDFSFYDTLPNQKTPVPQTQPGAPKSTAAAAPTTPSANSAPPAPAPAAPLATPAAPAADATWIVQVGSYRSAEEADGVRAKLALAGIATRTQKAEVNGTTWYRVRSGPLSLEDATALRDRLKTAGTNAIAMRGND